MRARLVPISVALALACSSSPPLSESHAVAMRDSVMTALETFTRHSAAGQWDSVVSLYDDAPSFRWVEAGQVRYRSPDDIRTSLAAFPDATSRTMYHDTEITPLAPGVAHVVTGFQTEFTNADGSGFSFGGVITMLFVHRGAGWRIAGGHASSPPAPDR